MVSVQTNTAESLSIPVYPSKRVSRYNARNLYVEGAGLLVRFWWHAKAYGTILSILLLALGSLVFLSIHWSCRKLLLITASQQPKENS